MDSQECHGPTSSGKRGRPHSSFRVDYPVPSMPGDGSDTEEEDNAEMEEYYLSRANKRRGADTVFGKAARTRKSREVTVYTHIKEQTFHDKVLVSKRLEHQQGFHVSTSKYHDTPIDAQVSRLWTLSPCNSDKSTTAATLPSTLMLPSRPIQPQSASALVYDTSTLDDTVFHHGSAGTNLRSASTRPFLPVLHSSKDSPLPPADCPPLPTRQTPCQLSVQTLRLNDDTRDTHATEQCARRIFSGSFGTFQDQSGRFDERPYRLLPGKEAKEKERESWVGEMDGGKRRVYHNGGLNPLKARPWLRK